MKAKVLSVNISKKKGTLKQPQNYILLNELGIENDAHAGKWHRQVSIMSWESINKFSQEFKRETKFGDFAENITTEGILSHNVKPFDRLIGEQVELEVTQIGKKCHGDNCTVYREVGNCIMPNEGIFARVIKGGKIKPGDDLKLQKRIWKVVIITLSDRASSGEYKDISGPVLEEYLKKHYKKQNKIIETKIIVIPDEARILEEKIKNAVDENCDLLITTGGTGIGPRDITPDVIIALIDKEIPGIMELIRVKYGMKFPNALLSRGIAGVIGKMQIYTLPGNPKAIKEYCDEIFKTLDHAFLMIAGIDAH